MYVEKKNIESLNRIFHFEINDKMHKLNNSIKKQNHLIFINLNSNNINFDINMKRKLKVDRNLFLTYS